MDNKVAESAKQHGGSLLTFLDSKEIRVYEISQYTTYILAPNVEGQEEFAYRGSQHRKHGKTRETEEELAEE